ncbi:FKBP-type peptidylprolyl isomerase [Flavobacterium supellecticarium]|uniref:FKBP-type peptidylprolyl isomerase n=1 Tax=Flavobacterium supellecticarium TaxID=2565924 RepID=A0A4S3ZVF3_9FLAO|nr:FKBP-type peptidylprolyl isomerase [Flavobacterium supellecticarium]THF49798.1 FKBP-type peptidylprolyl isomerase [Flavobacterium supellecticarium]
MNRFFKIVGSALLMATLFACDDKGAATVELRDYGQQFASDIVAIENYLKTHYIEVDHNANGDVTNTTITAIPDGGSQVSIWDQTTYPLQTKIVKLHNIEYKVYYLKLAAGVGDAPCGIDKVYTSYKGLLLTDAQFDYAPNATEISLLGAIKGWEYIFPEFKRGTVTENPDGTLGYKDYGAGVVFLPSGLGYYASYVGSIPEYSPLIFSFKLYDIQFLDQDGDGVLSRYEYGFDANGALIDTDGDGVADVFDIDDDNDGVLTKDEIRIPGSTTGAQYTFDQIPLCTSGSGKKLHLDPACKGSQN